MQQNKICFFNNSLCSFTHWESCNNTTVKQDAPWPLREASGRRKLNLIKWLVGSSCKHPHQVDFVHLCVCVPVTLCEITSNAARQRRTAGARTTIHRSPSLVSIPGWTAALVSTSNSHRFPLHPRSSGCPPKRQRTLSRASLPALISQLCLCKK